MDKALVVGLTGPIGSGKSVVANIFCDRGYVAIDADKLAKKVVEKGSSTLQKLAKNFGDEVINPDGTLNRKMLAKKAFSSKESTALLNSITHPAILSLVKKEIEDNVSVGNTKIIYDAPQLFESGSDSLCDKIVCVIASKEQRIGRVEKRDNMPKSDIENRISVQYSDEFFTEKSDFIIENNSTLEELSIRVNEVVDEIEKVHNGSL